MATFFQRLFRFRGTRARRSALQFRPARWKRTILYLERLEDRLAPATLTVNSSADTISGTAATLDLREAILLVNSGGTATDSSGNSLSAAKASQISGTFGDNDTIQFASTLNGQTITLGGSALPDISKNVTITGLGASDLAISGNNKSSVFTIDAAAQVSISGLTIENGNAGIGNGGGILNSGSASMYSCTLSGNSASSGGGIYNNGGTLTIIASTLSDNSATNGDGGGIYNNGQLTVNNSTTLSDNSAHYEDGGGIANFGGKVMVNNGSTLFENGSGSGGGIFNSGQMTVSNVSISENGALGGGGGIYNARGTLTLNSSTIENNEVLIQSAGGGGIWNQGTLNVSNSILSANLANYAGGAIVNLGGMMMVSNSTLSDNRVELPEATSFGGGIFDEGGTLTLNSCTLENNSAIGGDGGGIVSSGTTTVRDCTLSNNSATNGGGIDNGDNLTVINSTIVGNEARLYGGGIANEDGGSVTLNNTLVADNTSGGDLNGSGFSGSNDLIGDGSGGLNPANNLLGSSSSPLDPLLAPLGNYGGPTETMALLPGSPAIDAGSNALVPSGVTTDQRGQPRIYGSAVDIGAFESQGFTLTVAGGNNQSAFNTNFAQPLTVTVTANNPLEPVDGGVVSFTAPSSGASATLSPSSAVISGGSAYVTAAANGTAGSYTVNATASGASTPADFSLTNLTFAQYLQATLPQGSTTTNTLTIQVSVSVTPATVIAAVNGLTNVTQPVTIILDLGGGTYSSGGAAANPPPNVTFKVQNGTLDPDYPALTVAGGQVVVSNCTLTTSGNTPTLLVTGGSVTLSNDNITQTATTSVEPAISVTGGTVNLGTATSPGNNTLSVNSSGDLVSNTSGNPISAVGDTFVVGGTVEKAPNLSFTTLTSSAATSLLNQAVTLTASVQANGSSGTPTGSVDFFDTTTNSDLGSVSLSGGVATLTTTALNAGTQVITATYSGSGTFLPSQGSTTLTVLAPSSLSGIVFEDFNDDGQVDFGEPGIAGVTITLTGTDDLGQAVNQTQLTDSDGAYIFLNLRPGNYYLTETQPSGYLQGIDTVGTAGGSLSATDQLFVTLAQGTNGFNYNYGEQPPAGGAVQSGQTATIGFWNNKNGQALINSFNGGSTSTQLGDWLAATLPNTFGANAGSNDVAGKSNADIAALFQSDFLLKGVKLDAQVLATALSVYATNATLDNTDVAANYGFIVSGNGLGTATVNVGSNGAAFGVADNSVLTVMDLLKATDAQAVGGLLYNGDDTLRKEANNVYSAINEEGDIG